MTQGKKPIYLSIHPSLYTQRVTVTCIPIIIELQINDVNQQIIPSLPNYELIIRVRALEQLLQQQTLARVPIGVNSNPI